MERYFLVDPLDGTREFIDRNGAFTINIAFIEHGESVAGCIYAPAMGSLFIGGEACFGLEGVAPEDDVSLSKLKPMSIRTSKPAELTALASHSHGDATTDEFFTDHASTKIIQADWFIFKILHDRKRGSRFLSPLRSYNRMGHCCRGMPF